MIYLQILFLFMGIVWGTSVIGRIKIGQEIPTSFMYMYGIGCTGFITLTWLI